MLPVRRHSVVKADKSPGRQVGFSFFPPAKLLWFQDVQMILPTAIILLITLIIMLTVIPYAFSTVFKQMEAIRALESQLLETEEGEGRDLRNIPNNTEDL